MINKSELILVTGITGQQGGAVASQLLRKGYNVRGLTRHPEKAGELRRLGAEIAVGDMTDTAAVAMAFRDVRRVFLVTTPFEKGMDAEVQQGMNVVDTALKSHVDHLVFTSVAAANKETEVPYYETKARIERYLRKSSLPATVIRPAFFMDNFGSPWIFPSLLQGVWRTPIRPDRPIQMIAVEDIARFAIAALEQPDEFVAVESDIAGDSVSFQEAVRLLSRVSGQHIRYDRMTYEECDKVYGPVMTAGFRWLDDAGSDVDLPWLAKQWGVRPLRFRDYLKQTPIVNALAPHAKAA
jgi:uncharacterized protein YbjT (DUF2867 family)